MANKRLNFVQWFARWRFNIGITNCPLNGRGPGHMTKGVNLTGLLGGVGLWVGSPPVGSRGGALVEGLGDEVPQKLKLFL